MNVICSCGLTGGCRLCNPDVLHLSDYPIVSTHTELCPVCMGKGTICNCPGGTPLYLHPSCPTCHGCSGKGYIVISGGN